MKALRSIAMATGAPDLQIGSNGGTGFSQVRRDVHRRDIADSGRHLALDIATSGTVIS